MDYLDTGIIRQMSVESEVHSSEVEESISYIEAALENIRFEPGDVVLKGNVRGIVVQNVPHSSQLRISNDEGRIEIVEPEELQLVQRCEEAQSPTPHTNVNFEDLGCCLCHDILCEPLTLPCGHTFCRLCVALTLQRAAKKCPTCRANCHITSSIQPENVLISKLCKQLFPMEYDRKLAETKAQMEKLARSHPIFYYNSFQFPHSTMSLCLFEPRYKIMIRRVISADQKFIYLPSFNNYRAEVGQIGLLCTVTTCEFDVQDRAFLDMTLNRRVIVTNTWVEHGTQNLSFAEYDFYDDDPERSEVTNKAKELFESGCYADMRGLHSVIESRQLGELSLPRPPPVQELDKAVWWCAEFLKLIRQLPIEKGSELLKTKSLQERLEIINVIRFPNPNSNNGRDGSSE